MYTAPSLLQSESLSFQKHWFPVCGIAMVCHHAHVVIALQFIFFFFVFSSVSCCCQQGSDEALVRCTIFQSHILGSLCRIRFSRRAATVFVALTSAPRKHIPRKRSSAHCRCPLTHRASHMTACRIVYIVDMVSPHNC